MNEIKELEENREPFLQFYKQGDIIYTTINTNAIDSFEKSEGSVEELIRYMATGMSVVFDTLSERRVPTLQKDMVLLKIKELFNAQLDAQFKELLKEPKTSN